MTVLFQLKMANVLGNPEWSLSGNQGNSWLVTQVNVAASKVSQPFQVQ